MWVTTAPPRALAQCIRVLVADDHPIFRQGLRRLLDSQPDFLVIGEVGDGAEAVLLASKLRPDIVMLDLALPGVSGLEALKELSKSRLPIRPVVLTTEIKRDQILKALQLGACGVLLKSHTADLVLKALRTVMTGQHWIDRKTVSDLVEMLREVSRAPSLGRFGLTPRQLQIVSCVASGLANRDIAAKLAISEDTVKHHLTQIFTRTGVTNRLELALFAMQHQLSPGE
jgi:two-component system nitrate/nitrite response regulator NarL